ncbi:MAG: YigZ family protein [Bacteroidales bacterium]|nr:YigZ family protein [Bacteroidales bacterium]
MLFDDTYRTIRNRATGQYKEKGSKFIAIASPVRDENEVKKELEAIRKEYYDARHHCYAYVIGFNREAYRINDDGEPSGTAGRPIHGQILSYDLTNVLIVVVRYFGGIKLGVSGLINAYKTAAGDALSQAEIAEMTVNEVYEVSFDYTVMNEIMKIVKEENLELLNTKFDLDCSLIFKIRKREADRVNSRIRKTYKSKVIYLRSE